MSADVPCPAPGVNAGSGAIVDAGLEMHLGSAFFQMTIIDGIIEIHTRNEGGVRSNGGDTA